MFVIKVPAGMTGTKLLQLEKKALGTIRRYGMIDPGDGIVVAVSGGADSVALLLLMQRLAPRFRLSVSAAHLNHKLRGAESDADEQFVRDLCRRLGVDLVVEEAAVKEAATLAKQNLEETARKARYDFLRRSARRSGARRIAVGHTLDDQAETVLMRFLRGSGTTGLAAIRPVVGGIIVRPLIEVGREEVLRYLLALGISHREDSSNRDLSLRRNRLRHELIPALRRTFNPKLAETLARTAELARETSDLLDALSAEAYERIRTAAQGGVLLPAKEMAAMHPVLQKLVLRRALREVRGSLLGIRACHADSLVRLCRFGKSGQVVELPGGCTAVRQFGRVTLLPEPPEAAHEFEYDLPIPGNCFVSEAAMEISASVVEPGSCPAALLDGDAIGGKLTVRSRRPGDRYGGAGHRKVKKMLIDARIDLAARARLPVLVIDDAVVWMPGFKPARNFAARPDSSRAILIESRAVPGKHG